MVMKTKDPDCTRFQPIVLRVLVATCQLQCQPTRFSLPATPGRNSPASLKTSPAHGSLSNSYLVNKTSE